MEGGSTLKWAGYLLGFALGGFFDGILLHQVLQWHHLLSGVGSIADLRTQVLADGAFHLLMYVVAAIGLALLWRSGQPFGRLAAACALGGFGAWHVADGVLSHWLLGLHRIRMDTVYPLAYDLAWLAVFGLVPLVAGLALRHGAATAGRRVPPFAVALLVASAGAAAIWPGRSDAVTVLFDRPVSLVEMAGMLDDGGRVLAGDASGRMWTVSAPRSRLHLYRNGAVAVGGLGSPFACLDWTRG